MRKIIVITCVAALMLGLMAAAANAGVGNWIVNIKAFNDQWGGAGRSADIAIQPTASQTSNTAAPTANSADVIVEEGSTYYTKRRLANTTAVPNTWNLKVGTGTGTGFPEIRIVIWNNAADGLSGKDQALDTNLAYVFKNGENVIATFATTALKDTFAARDAALTNWVDIGQIMKAKGWTPGTADRGWWYADTTYAQSATNAGLEAYSFGIMSAPAAITPEPGSLMALGSGLVGLVGFAIRRRRA